MTYGCSLTSEVKAHVLFFQHIIFIIYIGRRNRFVIGYNKWSESSPNYKTLI